MPSYMLSKLERRELMGRPRKTLLINPDPANYSGDNCTSFAKVNHRVEFQPLSYVSNVVIQPVDWNRALNKRRIDWYKLRLLAQSWVTCACGNACIVIPRNEETGSPLDSNLRRLGVQFYSYIVDEKKEAALAVLKAIEHRSQLIINRIYAQLKPPATKPKEDSSG